MIEVIESPIKPRLEIFPKRPIYSSEDDKSVITSTETLRRELDDLHNRFDQATEPILVESIIYEIQAVQLRYIYYLNLCKERGLVCDRWKV